MNVTVWRCDLDRGIVSLDTLDDGERARAAAFVFERHRRRYIAAHTFLRGVLGSVLGVAAMSLRFAAAAHGKPYLPAWPSLAFNMSHSEHIAYLAIASTGDIGVDVELHRDLDDLLGVARTVFSPVEVEEVIGAAGEARTAAFLRCWTRKEAYVKAVGVGLGDELTSITVRTSMADTVVPPRLGVSRASFHIRSLQGAHREYAAVATSAGEPGPISVAEFQFS